MGNDLISLSGLKKQLETMLDNSKTLKLGRKYQSEGGYIAEKVLALCIRAVDEAAAVDAVPVVHGQWIHTKIEDSDWGGTFNSWKCSVCGYYAGRNPTGTNYCPNCGAKMDGGNDG